jgi:hypothetical protein
MKLWIIIAAAGVIVLPLAIWQARAGWRSQTLGW